MAQPLVLQDLLDGDQRPKATSQQVLDRFGPDAPAVLNQYCCILEDALLAQQARLSNLQERLEMLEQENQRLRQRLTSRIQ